MGRAIALVRQSTTMSVSASPAAVRRAVSSAMAAASDPPSELSHNSTTGPLVSERSCLARRSWLLTISADAAATIRRELLRLRASAMVRADGNLPTNRSRLARDAPRNL